MAFVLTNVATNFAWLWLCATIAVFAAMMLSPKDALDEKIASVGIVDLDGGPFWDEEFVRKLCAGYGEDGRVRAAMGYLSFIHDCTFALCYSVTMSLSLFAMTGKNVGGNSAVKDVNGNFSSFDPRYCLILCTMPLLAGLCDIGENFSVARLLLSYPNFDPAALRMGPLFSKMKLIFFLVSISMIIYHKFFTRRGRISKSKQ